MFRHSWLPSGDLKRQVVLVVVTATLANAAIPAFQCPKGTKMWLLDLGTLECDEGWLLRGGNTSTLSNLDGGRKRRQLIVLSVLIEHPEDGLILYETGCAEDINTEWSAVPYHISQLTKSFLTDLHKGH